ncbi:N-acetylmuramidase family protein [Dyella sp.]|uniref:N-acetylmuramidase family protein n=1 Tax=Dyella sp. TaxID=1869338 RepID=UPI002B4975E5|nr:N-acetylmuramidase family protein [Dyella sp.]HKT27294.1 N-acetylmuramidase family protein [Dyella sp.]
MANTCDPGPIFSLLSSQTSCGDQRYFDPLKPISPQPNWLPPVSTLYGPWNGPIVPPAPAQPTTQPDISLLFTDTKLQPQTGITDDQFKTVADKLGVEVAVIKAFAKVETGHSPFDSLGRPAILYERHYFHKLTKGQFDATHPHISDPTPYHKNVAHKKAPHSKHAKKGAPATPAAPPAQTQPDKPKDDRYGTPDMQYPRLKEAYLLDKAAALQSASWGRFQIMGANYKATGHPTVESLVLALIRSEFGHLEAFAGFVGHTPALKKACQEKDWANMARLYNGPGYKKYNYDQKLSAAYDQFK